MDLMGNLLEWTSDPAGTHQNVGSDTQPPLYSMVNRISSTGTVSMR